MRRSDFQLRWFWVLLIVSLYLNTAAAAPKPKATSSMTTVQISCANSFSGGEASECKVGVGEGHEDAISIKVLSSNPALVAPDVNEVTLAPKQSYVKVNLKSHPTQIKSTVTITASLSSNGEIRAQESIEIVSARMASATLSAPSFFGTHGAKTNCRVKLRAPAPPGGIQIYLSPLLSNIKHLTLQLQNPTVLAGQDDITFDIEYDKIRFEDNPVSGVNGSYFNVETRTVGLVVALDPQLTSTWTATPGVANKVTFDVIPLQINSFSVQPSTLSGGAESLASFTLNSPPGNYEKIYLRPFNDGSSKFWVALSGTSCVATTDRDAPLELPLIAGTTNYSFKVCSHSVTTSSTGKVTARLRSGTFEAPVTLQP